MEEEQLEFDFSDGKDRTEETELESKKRLENLLDLGRMNAYGTLDKEIFAEQVDKMSLAAMRGLAIRVGVTPVNNTEKLKRKLLDNFDSYVNQHSLATKPPQSISPNSEIYKSIEHLLK